MKNAKRRKRDAGPHGESPRTGGQFDKALELALAARDLAERGVVKEGVMYLEMGKDGRDETAVVELVLEKKGGKRHESNAK